MPDVPVADAAERQCPFPEVVERELAVLVRARNSVVAAWLWRQHAHGLPLAANTLRVDACCQVAHIDETKA
jgi:hypothetical protein